MIYLLRRGQLGGCLIQSLDVIGIDLLGLFPKGVTGFEGPQGSNDIWHHRLPQ